MSNVTLVMVVMVVTVVALVSVVHDVSNRYLNSIKTRFKKYGKMQTTTGFYSILLAWYNSTLLVEANSNMTLTLGLISFERTVYYT